MKTAVDIVNFVLIWVTLCLSIAWPFEVFLFSYIVLGPLHYLTEINWLDKQNYFLRKQDTRAFVWGMVALVSLLTLGAIAQDTDAWKWTKPLHDSIYGTMDHPLSGNPVREVLRWSWVLILMAFVFAAAWLFTEKWPLRIGIVIFCLLSTLFFYTNPALAILFGVLLPTIGHVFLFTLLFMLYGTLKNHSVWGYLNVISMVAVVVIIAVVPRTVPPDSLNPSVIQLSIDSAFLQVNQTIGNWLGLNHGGQIEAYSPGFFKIQSFIAFAYTYHYLNWFSKTSIIKWHQVEKKKFIFSAVLWVASLAIYKVDYRLGFAAVSALSILHIVLEFPLNFVSVRGIVGAFAPGSKPVRQRSRA